MIKKFTSIDEIDEKGISSNNLNNITVIGVGGAGCNAINNMIELGLTEVNFVVVNTDLQSLNKSLCKNRIQIGPTLAKGLGAGSRPEIGLQAAEESRSEIEEVIKGSNMVFIACGMGGGTGTGASQVIAKIAKEMGILTIAFVTKPFEFEGIQRSDIALLGIAELEKIVDSLVVISNQNLFQTTNKETTIINAFKEIDNILYSGIKAITDLIVANGIVNLDFNDVKSVIEGMGRTMISSAEFEGEQRVAEIIKRITYNPLLENKTIKHSKKILISIVGGDDLTLHEVNEIILAVKKELAEDSFVIFGTIHDSNYNGKIKVSVVATGLPEVTFEEDVEFISFDNQEIKKKIDDISYDDNSKHILKDDSDDESHDLQKDTEEEVFVINKKKPTKRSSLLSFVKQDNQKNKNEDDLELEQNVTKSSLLSKKITIPHQTETFEKESGNSSFTSTYGITENFDKEDFFEDGESEDLFNLIAKKNKKSQIPENIEDIVLIKNRNKVESNEEHKEESFFDLPAFLKK